VLGANSRANVDMSALLTSPDYNASGERFGTIIESLDNVGIAVERALLLDRRRVLERHETPPVKIR
jgi:hypothetical protein